MPTFPTTAYQVRQAESGPSQENSARRITPGLTAGVRLPQAGPSFKRRKEEALEDAGDLPAPEELATHAIAELAGAVSIDSANLHCRECGLTENANLQQ